MDTDNLLEMFNLSPFDTIDPSEFLFENGENHLKIILEEAANGTTKQNIFQKLMSIIKRIFDWICKQFSKFINFIKSLSAKKIVPIDYIAKNVLKNHSIKESSINESTILEKIKKHIIFPSNPRSEYTPPPIDIISKEIIFDINKKTRELYISYGAVYNSYDNGKFLGNNDKNTIPAQTMSTPNNLYYLYKLMYNIKIQSAMLNAVSALSSNSPNNFVKYYNIMKHEYANKTVDVDEDALHFTVSDFINFQKHLDRVHSELSKIDCKNLSFDNNSIRELNEFSSDMASLQMGMNIVFGALTSVHIIDAKYLETIDDIDTLGEFINECIKNRIPSKYIAFNAYLISSKNIKGNEGNEHSPIWGQSRVVFYPLKDKTSVYKLALSQWGIRSNTGEFNISNIFKKYNGGKYLAETKRSINDGSIIISERVKLVEQPGVRQEYIDDLESDINHLIQKNNMQIVIHDLHSGNVGIKNNSLVAIDYGFISKPHKD